MADLKAAYGYDNSPNVITLEMPDTRTWWQKLLRRKNKGFIYQGQAIFYSNDTGRIIPATPTNMVIGVALEDSYRDENGNIIGAMLVKMGGDSGCK